MKHIKSFQQLDEEFSYLVENLNINDIVDNFENAMAKKENYEPTLSDAWERCKKQHKYERLSKLPQGVVMHLLMTILTIIPTTIAGPVGLFIGTIFTILSKIEVLIMISEEIKKGGPESQALKQEIGWLYDCLRQDQSVINLIKKYDL